MDLFCSCCCRKRFRGHLKVVSSQNEHEIHFICILPNHYMSKQCIFSFTFLTFLYLNYTSWLIVINSIKRDTSIQWGAHLEGTSIQWQQVQHQRQLNLLLAVSLRRTCLPGLPGVRGRANVFDIPRSRLVSKCWEKIDMVPWRPACYTSAIVRLTGGMRSMFLCTEPVFL